VAHDEKIRRVDAGILREQRPRLLRNSAAPASITRENAICTTTSSLAVRESRRPGPDGRAPVLDHLARIDTQASHRRREREDQRDRARHQRRETPGRASRARRSV